MNIPHHVAIIGTGLIGGSISLALKTAFSNDIVIYGSTNTISNARKAVKAGIIDAVLPDQKKFPRSVELIIFATPVLTTISLLKQLQKLIPDGCVVMDTGSTKAEVCTVAQKVLSPSTISFIGTHPMAGKETSGYIHADKDLFRDKPWIICPTPVSSQKARTVVTELIHVTKAIPVEMTAERHDELAVWASHLSLLISTILMKTVAEKKSWREISSITSTGLRDMTRLAGEHPEMKRDILLTNKHNILPAIRILRDELDKVYDMLKREKDDDLYTYLKIAKLQRDMWLQREKK